MAAVKQKSIDHYIERIQAHILKRYPHLSFEVVKWDDRDATLYYEPYSEDDEYPIVTRAGSLMTDALVDGGYRIQVIPAP